MRSAILLKVRLGRGRTDRPLAEQFLIRLKYEMPSGPIRRSEMQIYATKSYIKQGLSLVGAHLYSYLAVHRSAFFYSPAILVPLHTG